jgi:hypothetical protein
MDKHLGSVSVLKVLGKILIASVSITLGVIQAVLMLGVVYLLWHAEFGIPSERMVLMGIPMLCPALFVVSAGTAGSAALLRRLPTIIASISWGGIGMLTAIAGYVCAVVIERAPV